MRRFMVILLVMSLLLMGCDSGDVSSKTQAGAGEDTATGTAGTAENVAAGASEEEQETVKSTFTNLKEAMAAGKTMKCTWSYSDQNGNMEGEVIVSGDKFKTEASFKGSGQDFTSYSVSDGNYIYVWTDAPESKAMKMAMPEEGDYDTPDEGSAQYVDLEANYNYKCTPTVAGPGTFTPPNKDFVDLSKMMEDMQAMSGKYNNGEEVDMDQMQADMEDLAAQYQ